MTERNIIISLVVFLLPLLAFAAEVPDIPMGSKFYIENKSQSDESVRFAMLLAEKLAKDEGNKRYQKPGFSVVEEREGADYIIRFSLVVRENGHETHAWLNALLLDAAGKVLWRAEDFRCATVFAERVEGCASELSGYVKRAEVNSEGKRAGYLGWKIKK